ncbi:MAG: hypothetical protein FWE91_00195 [Defluviitaleaceae bacterium]|nr:hypothetical protein [Defluviitaleaceae bacterium]MCL2836921.1 hypothetical protein [Defluviitaleaceae bacterium]
MKIDGITANDFMRQLKETQSAANSISESAENAGITAKQQNLGGLLKRVEMMNGMMYSGASWNALMKAYGKAKPLSMNESRSVKDLNKAISELTAALAALEAAEKEADGEFREGLPVILDIALEGSKTSADAAAASLGAPASAGVDVSV